MKVWPFPPQGDLIETLEWRTDVLRARQAEQRLRLLDAPRRTWQFKHVLTQSQYAAARALLRGTDDAFAVPDWTRALYAGAIAAGTSVPIALDTSDLDLRAGDSLVIWGDAANHEIVTLESLSAGQIVLSEVTTARSALLYAADPCQALEGLRVTRPAGPVLQAEIAFTALVGVPDLAGSGYPTYRGQDVLTDVPVVGAAQLDESLAWPMDALDAAGPLSVARQRDLPDDLSSMRWHVFTAVEQRALRRWLYRRAGRARAFWRSTGLRDLEAAADLAAAATTLRVFAPPGASDLGETAFDLEIHAGSLHRRRVLSVSAGTPVGGRAVLDLALEAALGEDIGASQFGRISYLRCLRHAADRIELQHAPRAGFSVAVPLIEVPVP